MVISDLAQVKEIYAEAAGRGWVLPCICSENLTTTESIMAAAADYGRDKGIGDVPVIIAITCNYSHRAQAPNYTHTRDCNTGLKLFFNDIKAMTEKGAPFEKLRVMVHLDHIEQCGRYMDTVGKESIMRITGVNPHPMYSLPKLGWFRENKHALFEKTAYIFLMEDFIIFRLCGERVIDYSLAARTMAFDVTKKKWDSNLLALAGVHEKQMSSPVPSGTVAGKILPKMAGDLGVSKQMLVVTGGHDQVCTATGAGIVKPGLAIDGIGTVECITPVFDKPILSKEFLGDNYACVPHSIHGMYVTYAVNFTGGSILKWYRDNFAKHEMQQAKKQGISVYQLLDNQAAKTPTDIVVVPHFAGSGTPDMNAVARGSISGLRFDTDAGTLYRALLEGVTYEMKYNMERLESFGIRFDRLKAAGGGARSALWLQIKADITGCPIVPLKTGKAGATAEAGAVGAAMLAAVAAGIYPSLDEALPHFVHEKEVVMPSENHELYPSRLYE